MAWSSHFYLVGRVAITPQNVPAPLRLQAVTGEGRGRWSHSGLSAASPSSTLGTAGSAVVFQRSEGLRVVQVYKGTQGADTGVLEGAAQP